MPNRSRSDDLGEAPTVSVVIASVNGLPAIAECLQALVRQQTEESYEVIVVDRCGEATRKAIRDEFPREIVRVIEVEGHPSIPKLRAVGMRQARGHMIAILEDHCNVAPNWVQVVARAHRNGVQALGGAVENGSVDRMVDWAAYFCEYARFMPPVVAGTVSEITGNNSAYDRLVLERLGPDLEAEVWEGFLHARLRELGVSFVCDPELVVDHKKEFGFVYFMNQRYHYSRSFAGMRLRGQAKVKRVAYAVATILLPPVVFIRIARTVIAKGRRRGRFVGTVPVLIPFLVAWAWGETVGALFGPGESLARVE